MPALKKTKRQQTAANIKRLFKDGLNKKDWTQNHLAEVMHRRPALISKAFNEPFKRDFELLYDIADKLNVNLGEVFGR